MTILTVAVDEGQYVRIIGSFDMMDHHKVHVGKVGKLMSKTDPNEEHKMVFVHLVGDERISVFNSKDVDTITEKEYFVACLGGK